MRGRAKNKRMVVIGVGSGGWILAYFGAYYLNFLDDSDDWTLMLVDADVYTIRNAAYQRFHKLDNKAVVQKELLQEEFSNLTIEAVPEYVTAINIPDIVLDGGDYVFLAVDNHASRKLVSDHCQQLRDVYLLSGGIGGTRGHVHLYIRRKGKDVTPPLTYLHPEISDPEDTSPADTLPCEEQIASSGEPQILFTSLTTAAMTLAAFHTLLHGDTDGYPSLHEFPYSELYIDIAVPRMRHVLRQQPAITPSYVLRDRHTLC